MLRIIVAEADPDVRAAVLSVLRSSQGIELVQVSDDGEDVVAMTARHRPDLVLMGAKLRSIDGLRATSEIMIDCPTPIVLLAGEHTREEVDLTVRALSSGALAVLDVPRVGETAFARKSAEFLSKLRAFSEVRLVRRWRARAKSPLARSAPRGPSSARAVMIASSTGGPAVLEAILSRLPKNYPIPCLVVQHIAPGFVDGLASWLDQITAVSVKVAEHGESLKAGTVYLAPDDHHLGVSRTGRLLLSKDAPIGGFRPSASYLFDSAARAYGSAALAMILTGMGRDGVEGLRSVRSRGGRVVAQDEATSVVFGMPKVAVEEGLVDAVLPVDKLGDLLLQLVKE